MNISKRIGLTVVTAILALGLQQTSFAVTFDTSVPKPVQDQMIADLQFMTTLDGGTASPLHAKIFATKIEGTGYKTFFESRVQKIGFDTCGNPNAVACVRPNMFGKTIKMSITNNYIKFSHPQISRMMVVYHEARHTENQNGNWGHANCPTPFKNEKGEDMKSIWTGAPLAGEPACDVTPFGSYGSSTILLKNISKFCKNCTQKVKMDAGIYADDQFGRVIDAKARQEMLADVFKSAE